MSSNEFDRLHDGDFDYFGRLKTALTLGVISTTAFALQKAGITHDMASPGKEITESLSHPLLGYIGAWIGLKCSSQYPKETQNPGRAMLIGATIANFATEKAQDVIASSAEADFLALQNLPETGKDYLFALGGLIVFSIEEQRRSKANQIE